jgi:hypothetical protein
MGERPGTEFRRDRLTWIAYVVLAWFAYLHLGEAELGRDLVARAILDIGTDDHAGVASRSTQSG